MDTKGNAMTETTWWLRIKAQTEGIVIVTTLCTAILLAVAILVVTPIILLACLPFMAAKVIWTGIRKGYRNA